MKLLRISARRDVTDVVEGQLGTDTSKHDGREPSEEGARQEACRLFRHKLSTVAFEASFADVFEAEEGEASGVGERPAGGEGGVSGEDRGDDQGADECRLADQGGAEAECEGE